jgi:hypothetical protein
MGFENGNLCMVDRPEPKEPEYHGPPKRGSVVRLNVIAQFKPGERIVYSPQLGASDKTFYKTLKEMIPEGLVEKRADGFFYRTRTAATVATVYATQ